MANWEESKHPRDKSGQFTSKGNEGQGGSEKKPQIKEKNKQIEIDEDFDNDFEEEFLENIDNIDYDKAEENEKKNADKGRKSDGSLSNEAFKIGQKGAKTYLDFMTQYNDLDKLKGSNIFLGGLQSAVSKAITEAGYNPNFELTYKDFNDVVGSVLGEEVDYEEYERNATKGFTGKKYQNKEEFDDDKSYVFDKWAKETNSKPEEHIAYLDTNKKYTPNEMLDIVTDQDWSVVASGGVGNPNVFFTHKSGANYVYNKQTGEIKSLSKKQFDNLEGF